MPEKEKYFRFQANGNNFEGEIEMCSMNKIDIMACVSAMIGNLIEQGRLDTMDLGFIFLAIKHGLKKEGNEEDGD